MPFSAACLEGGAVLVLVVISRVEARSDTLFTRRCTRRRGVCVCRKDACQDNEQRGTQTHVRGSRRL